MCIQFDFWETIGMIFAVIVVADIYLITHQVQGYVGEISNLAGYFGVTP